MADRKHYPVLLLDQSGDLADVDETGGASVSQSVREPVVQMAPGVPQDKRDFNKWLKKEHARLNGHHGQR